MQSIELFLFCPYSSIPSLECLPSICSIYGSEFLTPMSDFPTSSPPFIYLLKVAILIVVSINRPLVVIVILPTIAHCILCRQVVHIKKSTRNKDQSILFTMKARTAQKSRSSSLSFTCTILRHGMVWIPPESSGLFHTVMPD